MNECFKYFNITNHKVKGLYFKNICYNFDFIKKQIQENKPMVLNMHKHPYYGDHSVTIVGYAITVSGKQYLVIYDNWYNTTSYIDFQKLNIISSINWLS